MMMHNRSIADKNIKKGFEMDVMIRGILWFGIFHKYKAPFYTDDSKYTDIGKAYLKKTRIFYRIYVLSLGIMIYITYDIFYLNTLDQTIMEIP